MRVLGLAAALTLAVISTSAKASVYISAGYKASQAHSGWQSIDSKGISGGLSVDLGNYIRLGYTHDDSYQTVQGLESPDSETTPRGADGYADPRPVYSKVHTISDSLDVQAVLYAGQVVTPYLIGGAALRHVITTTYDPVKQEMGVADSRPPKIPEPQGGLGLRVNLNAACSLTLQYLISSGIVATPNDVRGGEAKVKRVTDGSTSVGLNYKI